MPLGFLKTKLSAAAVIVLASDTVTTSITISDFDPKTRIKGTAEAGTIPADEQDPIQTKDRDSLS